MVPFAVLLLKYSLARMHVGIQKMSTIRFQRAVEEGPRHLILIWEGKCSLAVELVCKLGDLNRHVVPQKELIVVLKNINQHLSVIPRMMFT